MYVLYLFKTINCRTMASSYKLKIHQLTTIRYLKYSEHLRLKGFCLAKFLPVYEWTKVPSWFVHFALDKSLDHCTTLAACNHEVILLPQRTVIVNLKKFL